MTRCRTMAAVLRWCAAAAWCALAGSAAAAGLSTTLPDGQSLAVLETSTPEHIGFSFERRRPDGMRDRQFGPLGRVFFAMGPPGPMPTAVQGDAAGHLFVAATAPFDDGVRGAVVSRFSATGQVDAAWGDHGLARLPVAHGDAVPADVLPQADGGLLVVGTVEDGPWQQAAIWRLTASGQADASFGRNGVMLAAALARSQALSIQSGSDGTLQIAIQNSEGGRPWLEVHRWRSGAAYPLRVARQELPDQWVGPASLVFADDRWVWLDPGRPESAVAVVMLREPDAPWTPADPRPPALAATPEQPGHAAMNPYAGTAIGVRSAASPEPPSPSRWPALAVVAMLVAGALAWWSSRH